MRVLVVEDDVKLAGIVRRGLRAHGFSADVAIRGEDALWMGAATDYGATCDSTRPRISHGAATLPSS